MESKLVYFGPRDVPLAGDPTPGPRLDDHAEHRPRDWGFIATLPRELGEDCVRQIGQSLLDGGAGRGLFLLAPWLAPPASGYRDDGGVRWFALSRAAAEYARGIHAGDPAAVYRLLSRFARGLSALDRLQAIQFGRPGGQLARLQASRAGVTAVVPHRGRFAHLRAAVASLNGQRTSAGLQVAIGLDQACGREADLTREPSVRLFEAGPTGVGHFAIRQALIDRAETEFIALQDSDDLSCSNRIEVCRAAMEGGDRPDIFGCHEVRLDEIEETVTLRRYPLDVNRALGSDARGGILHGTIFARRSVFAATGGFSTVLKFAADTQFKLRASLLVAMRNLDEFLYIRRVHADSLTARPETRLGSPARERLRAVWERDYRLVRSGLLTLDASSLRPLLREHPIALRELKVAPEVKPRTESDRVFAAAAGAR